MKRLLVTLALILFTGLVFAGPTPARALPIGMLGEVSKAMPASHIGEARCRWWGGRIYCRRHYRPHFYFYFRPYYYRHCYRRCYRHYGHWHCYCR